MFIHLFHISTFYISDIIPWLQGPGDPEWCKSTGRQNHGPSGSRANACPLAMGLVSRASVCKVLVVLELVLASCWHGQVPGSPRIGAQALMGEVRSHG